MRLATWNLNCRRPDRANMSRIVDLIGQEDLDVLLLQEVTPGDMAALTALFDDGVCSLDVPRKDGNRSGRVGCAVMSRREVRLDVANADLIYDLHQPERGLYVPATWQESPLDLLSWHAPNAKQHGRDLKEKAFRAVAKTLDAWTGHSVAGMDTNFPEDPLDLVAADEADKRPDWRFHWDLLGASPMHNLEDVARALADEDSEGRIGPDGPLATTHLAGTRAVRFDRILITSTIKAARVRHLMDEGVAAGSDHALVVVELAVA